MDHGRSDYNERIQDSATPTSETDSEEGEKVPSHIGEDEPVFLLRAQDRAAPATIRAYVKNLKANNGNPLVIQSAEKQATAIEEWQEANPKAIHRASL